MDTEEVPDPSIPPSRVKIVPPTNRKLLRGISLTPRTGPCTSTTINIATLSTKTEKKQERCPTCGASI